MVAPGLLRMNDSRTLVIFYGEVELGCLVLGILFPSVNHNLLSGFCKPSPVLWNLCDGGLGGIEESNAILSL
jgi:hypothetical protein